MMHSMSNMYSILGGTKCSSRKNEVLNVDFLNGFEAQSPEFKLRVHTAFQSGSVWFDMLRLERARAHVFKFGSN